MNSPHHGIQILKPYESSDGRVQRFFNTTLDFIEKKRYSEMFIHDILQIRNKAINGVYFLMRPMVGIHSLNTVTINNTVDMNGANRQRRSSHGLIP
jgi:hypothetical protein